jgi:type II secretory pathway pseudopilin PulG
MTAARVRSGARGMTAIEMAVSLSVVSAVLLVGASALGRTFRASSDMNRTDDLERRAELAIEDVEAALADAGRANLSACAPPAGASSITFQCASGFAADDVTWRNQQRIEWVVNPSDATMGSVVWKRDFGLASQTSVTLATNVPALAPGETANSLDDNGDGLADEKGLSFSRTGNAVRARLSIKRKNSAGSWVTVTAERTIALRNE